VRWVGTPSSSRTRACGDGVGADRCSADTSPRHARSPGKAPRPRCRRPYFANTKRSDARSQTPQAFEQKVEGRPSDSPRRRARGVFAHTLTTDASLARLGEFTASGRNVSRGASAKRFESDSRRDRTWFRKAHVRRHVFSRRPVLNCEHGGLTRPRRAMSSTTVG